MRRFPGGLFWKVFLACWLTAMLTGLGITTIALIFPNTILPTRPPGVGPSVAMPIVTGGMMALLISGFLAWTLSRPIRLLRRAFSNAASGKLETRLTPLLGRRRDEFAGLGRDFDRMAQRLQVLLGSQRRLLHDVSHELRSPLARLQMAVGLLRRSPHGLDAALVRIEHEVQRLDVLVGEVLTLAHLESGAALHSVREVDLIVLLASVADDARFEARAVGRELDFCAMQASAVVPVNGELLLRAFENVIRNAVKFTPVGSRVEVRVEVIEHGRRLRVTVGDRGPGLSAQDLSRIFEPFVRHDAGSAMTGFGLGLAIAQRAVESHGGEIVASLREGGGLLLTLSLPLNDTPGRSWNLNQT